MNSKERYEEMIMEIMEFDSEDIIMTSCTTYTSCPENLPPVDPNTCLNNII